MQEADDADDTTAHHTHDQGVTIMPGVGTILSVRESETSHFLHTDAQGTTREATDSSQAVAATYDLDAFGVLRGSSGAFTTPYLFTGKERDAGPELDYFIARQYAPAIGVFLSKDPIPTPNAPYSYSAQAPLVAWDPQGAHLVLSGSAASMACGEQPGARQQRKVPDAERMRPIPDAPSRGECIEWLEDMMDGYIWIKTLNAANCVRRPDCTEKTYREWWTVRAGVYFLGIKWCTRQFDCYVECGWCGHKHWDKPMVTAAGSVPGGPCGLAHAGTFWSHRSELGLNCQWLHERDVELEQRCQPHTRGRSRSDRLAVLLTELSGVLGDVCYWLECFQSE